MSITSRTFLPELQTIYRQETSADMRLDCKECDGTGKVEFTKERGGPICNNCGGAGHITREIFERCIGSILDHPSVYMGGPSRSSLQKAQRIAEFLSRNNVEWN